MEPKQKEKTSLDEIEKINASTYKVLTFIPYTQSPETRKYLFTREELERFLEDYQHHAETIVAIVPVDGEGGLI